MEIKNANQTIITMDNNEFESFKNLIKQSCTVTEEVKQQVARTLTPSRIDNALYDAVKHLTEEDFCWSECAYTDKNFTRFHEAYNNDTLKAYEKIKQIYKTSVQMPDLFTDKERRDIRFEYALVLRFEREMNRLANIGVAMVDLMCAMDDGPDFQDWVFDIIDEVEGGESK